MDEVVSEREFTCYMRVCMGVCMRVGRNLLASQMVGGSRGPCVYLCLQMDAIFKLAWEIIKANEHFQIALTTVRCFSNYPVDDKLLSTGPFY